ncbi:hypothetical protein OJ998_28285 [Solirubrobacter taibaiensis]|nr:hypothetical protein [Solirubrobacter taibaiensis]
MKRTLLSVLFLLLLAPAAQAASVAYIADGEVWLASLDGTQRAKLAGHYSNSSGAVEKWNAVAQADNGRIVASRIEPGKISSLSWFQVWEPNGTSTIQSPLTMKGNWQLPVYPLSLDVSPDGGFMVYGYSHSSCCINGQYSFARGTYARPTAASSLEPIDLSGMEAPTLFGSRVIARSGRVVNVQTAVFSEDFTPWMDTTLTGLELRRTDVAADGRLIGQELEQWTNGTQTTGKIALISVPGVDQPPTFPAAVDCYVPATGVAKDVSLSQDATRVAWSDGDGLKVAGTPTTAADPCVLSAPAVLIAPKGATSASIGPANVSAFLPPPLPTGGGTGTPVVQPPAGTPTAPTATIPARVTRAALTKGLAIKVKAAAAGKITLSASVPAKALGRKGKAVVIATGSATARAAGTVTVKLKFNATGRKQSKRLKGKKVTLRVAQGTSSTTKTITLR